MIRRDHDDLDRALVAMISTETPVDELPGLLDVMRLALAVHITAEARVFASLLAEGVPPMLGQLIDQARDEHRAEQRAAAALAQLQPGCDPWYALAVDLRIHVLDHATRAELLQWSLEDHVAYGRRSRLAGAYATERMRVLERTSPVALAREATRDLSVPSLR